jgi:hypothetical protein
MQAKGETREREKREKSSVGDGGQVFQQGDTRPDAKENFAIITTSDRGRGDE